MKESHSSLDAFADPFKVLKQEHVSLFSQLRSLDELGGEKKLEHARLCQIMDGLHHSLAQHFRREESTLVKAICRADSEDWLKFAIADEHESLVSQLHEVREKIEVVSEGDAIYVRQELAKVVESIRSHIYTEENVLFWFADRKLTPEEKLGVLKELS